MDLVKVLTGSRLFGTHTDTSDYDYVTIFVPPIEDCILGRVNHASQTKDLVTNVEHIGWSLQHWIKLLGQGLEAQQKSTLQAEPDRQFLDDLIVDFYKQNVLNT